MSRVWLNEGLILPKIVVVGLEQTIATRLYKKNPEYKADDYKTFRVPRKHGKL